MHPTARRAIAAEARTLLTVPRALGRRLRQPSGREFAYHRGTNELGFVLALLPAALAEGGNVGDVMRSLAEQHPDTQRQLFGEDGTLNRYVNVYLNDEDVRVLEGLDTPVSERDTLVILPAMAGG